MGPLAGDDPAAEGQGTAHPRAVERQDHPAGLPGTQVRYVHIPDLLEYSADYLIMFLEDLHEIGINAVRVCGDA